MQEHPSFDDGGPAPVAFCVHCQSVNPIALQFCEHCTCVMLMGCDPSNPPPEVHHLETLQWDGETLSSISSQPKANTP